MVGLHLISFLFVTSMYTDFRVDKYGNVSVKLAVNRSSANYGFSSTIYLKKFEFFIYYFYFIFFVIIIYKHNLIVLFRLSVTKPGLKVNISISAVC